MISPYPFSSLESLAHFFFAAPVILYGLVQLVDHYRLFQKRILSSTIESFFVTGLGIFIFIGELLALSGCRSHSHCASVNVMHSLFGFMILEVGIIFMMSHTNMMKRSFNYYRFMVLSLVGLFMLLHDQPTEYAYLIHRSYGLACIIAGVAETIAVIYPSFTPASVTLLTLSQTLFLFGPDSAEKFFKKYEIMPMNAIFMAVCISLGIICIANTLFWAYARYKNIEFPDEDPEDIPGKGDRDRAQSDVHLH